MLNKAGSPKNSVTDFILRYGLLRDEGLKRRIHEELSATGNSDDARRYSQTAHEIFVALGAEFIRGRRPATSDITNLTGIPKSSARRGSSFLERVGILARSNDPNDGRRKFVELTEPYQRIVESFVDDCAIEFDDIINLFDRRERDAAELKYQSLFDTAQVSIWNKDFSEIFKALNQLRQDGVSDLRRYLGENKQAAWDMAKSVKITNVNNVTLKLFKANSEEEFIDSIDKVFGPGAIDVFIDELCAIWEKKEVFHGEANHKTLEGDDLTVLISMPIPVTEAEFLSVSVIIHDITEHKQAEAALRLSEERLTTMERIAKIGHWAWDEIEDRQIYTSKEATNIYGSIVPEYDFGAFLGLVHPDDRERVRVAIKQAPLAQKSYQVEYRIVRPDGETLFVVEQGEFEFDDDGKLVRSVGTIQDITERKQAEAALRLSEERLTTMERIAKVGHWAWDEIEGRGIYVSEEAGNIFGWILPAHDFEAFFFGLIHPDDRERVRVAIKQAPLAQKGYQVEYRIVRPDGEMLFVVEHGEFELDDDGKPVRSVGTIQDITEHKRAEEQLRQAQKMEVASQLTAGVAHDFNNLLAVIIGNVELLEDSVGGDENAQQHIEAVIGAVENASSLTSRLLAFSRRQPLSPVAADVTGLIGGLEDMLRRTLGETIELRVEATPDLRPAMIDPHQFENALVNLAVNARDAMPQGGTLTIETANVTLDETYAAQQEEVTPGDYVYVAVSDTGSGMPPEVLEKVFEPFFTTKEVGKGSGLGLSMVYGFAKQSGGHITIYSEVGHGTTVKLYLPRSEEDVAKDDTREVARESECILFVEGDENLRKIAVRTLRRQGYKVVEAGDGKQAIEHLQGDQHIDLLFADVVLPGGMNGVEIAEEAKRIQPGIKVLYTTGYTESAVVHNGQLDPSVTLVNKPYRRDELLEKVRAILYKGNA